MEYFRAMIIQEIIAIAGKAGLYRILVTNRSNLVVESMVDSKRLSIPTTSRISSLADITMYTTGEDILLMDVLNRMNEHIGSNETPEIKINAQATRDFMDEVIPELDHERIYNSDLKKLVQWFLLLRKNDAFPLEQEAAEEEEPIEKEALKDEQNPGVTKKQAVNKATAKK